MTKGSSMSKERFPKKVLVIGEEREGFPAYLGEVVYIANPGHQWGRAEGPPRFQLVDEELSIEEEKDLYTKLWKRDFNRGAFVSVIESDYDWDKDQVFAFDDLPSRGGDLEEAARIFGGPGANPEDVILKPFFRRDGDRRVPDPWAWRKYHSEILRLEHRLRAVVKRSTPALNAVRKSLFFAAHQDLKWLGGAVIEGRDRNRSLREQMVQLVQDTDVKTWLSQLWGLD